MLSADFVAEHSVELDLAEPRVVEVSDAITVRTKCFQFKEDFRGMETIPAAGTLIATDGAFPVSTPYDNCVLIMPSRRLRIGQEATTRHNPFTKQTQHLRIYSLHPATNRRKHNVVIRGRDVLRFPELATHTPAMIAPSV